MNEIERLQFTVIQLHMTTLILTCSDRKTLKI